MTDIRPPPPYPPEELVVTSPPFPCAWVTVPGTDFRTRRFLFPPPLDPQLLAATDPTAAPLSFGYTVEVTDGAAGATTTRPVVICSSPEPCTRPLEAESAAEDEGEENEGEENEEEVARAGAAVLNMVALNDRAAFASTNSRVQLPSTNYPEGVFVLASSDGSGQRYTVEVCTVASPPAAVACAESFGVLSVLRPADAWPSEADNLKNVTYSATHWSSKAAQRAAAASDSPAAVLTSTCAPPPGIDFRRKVVFSWGWDFDGLPPSLAPTGFVAVYRRYPFDHMAPGSYGLQFAKHDNVRLAVIVRFTDANPDVAGTPAAVREVVAAAENASLSIPGGRVSDITFVYFVPPLKLLSNITKMSASVTMTWRPSPPSPPPSPPSPPSPPPAPPPPSPTPPSPSPPPPPSPPPRPPQPPSPPPSPPSPPSPPPSRLPSLPQSHCVRVNQQSAPQQLLGSSATLRGVSRSLVALLAAAFGTLMLLA
ncbi:hypothetical protein VOLCADRAFT_91907 [Volvox carteri f. nagariensis]|uniref:Uncharacterized protein n=1 Tax=Volvox carteri f. nagariensis TaxID=3068 RepID=D8TY96_VOLCA|nr:uncharacterized protein VOLCADRAFT_91907 [Volvox carteri f. nagariensis]EFJ47607.1 hypothetical protein VOLCADRAFT_91907 [Volvox carteri f. nagariensis]|eukprot:XP_002951431.1 hypothetical protein VOLCADRAFT_91907 [Volvox carteri f. nagariensis]